MKEFMGKDFLLNSETAQYLYDNYACKMPIYDFHSHLSAQAVAEDKVLENITEAWLAYDHYKWRAMRTFGIDEKYITGDASDKDKFIKYAQMIPYTIGNPLYHWTHMELRKYFDIHDILNAKNAEEIYNKCNKKLESLSARKIIIKSNVKVIYTTDDPTDDLKYHKRIKEDKNFDVEVLPTFRPDKGINLNEDFDEWLKGLEKIENRKIDTFNKYIEAIENRIKYFDDMGCRLSDNGIENMTLSKCNSEEAESLFEKRIKKGKLNKQKQFQFRSFMLETLGRFYAKYNWTMQLHIGAIRNNSSKMYYMLGKDAGYDSIDDISIATGLSEFLDCLDKKNKLPKTIIYCLNPSDNEVVASMIGNFQGDGIKGKIQFGSGWWFNDQKNGIERQLEALSQVGLLSTFVGMVTDSRSLLSFSRHDYFRRILCDKLGNLVENGEYPNDMDVLGEIIENICYKNAEGYFINIKNSI